MAPGGFDMVLRRVVGYAINGRLIWQSLKFDGGTGRRAGGVKASRSKSVTGRLWEASSTVTEGATVARHILWLLFALSIVIRGYLHFPSAKE